MLADGAFDRGRTAGYLDTATYGLPPRATVAALEAALRGWQEWEDWHRWEQDGEECRALFGRIVGAAAEDVSLQPAVSAAAGHRRCQPARRAGRQRRLLRAGLPLGPLPVPRARAPGRRGAAATARRARRRRRRRDGPRGGQLRPVGRRARRRPGGAALGRRPRIRRRHAVDRRAAARPRRRRLSRRRRLQVAALPARPRLPLRATRAPRRDRALAGRLEVEPNALRALLRAAPRSDRGRATARYVARLVPGGRSPPEPRAARRARRGADRRARPRARAAVLRGARYPAQRIGDRSGRGAGRRRAARAARAGRCAGRGQGRRCPLLVPPLQRRGGCRPGARDRSRCAAQRAQRLRP